MSQNSNSNVNYSFCTPNVGGYTPQVCYTTDFKNLNNDKLTFNTNLPVVNLSWDITPSQKNVKKFNNHMKMTNDQMNWQFQ